MDSDVAQTGRQMREDSGNSSSSTDSGSLLKRTRSDLESAGKDTFRTYQLEPRKGGARKPDWKIELPAPRFPALSGTGLVPLPISLAQPGVKQPIIAERPPSAVPGPANGLSATRPASTSPPPTDINLTPEGSSALLDIYFSVSQTIVHRPLFELCWSAAGSSHPWRKIFAHPLLVNSAWAVGAHYALHPSFVATRPYLPSFYSRTLGLSELSAALQSLVAQHLQSTISTLLTFASSPPTDPLDTLAACVALSAGVAASYLDGQVAAPTMALRAVFYALGKMRITRSLGTDAGQGTEDELGWLVKQTWLRCIWFGFVWVELWVWQSEPRLWNRG
jgi:hypothetical protein